MTQARGARAALVALAVGTAAYLAFLVLAPGSARLGDRAQRPRADGRPAAHRRPGPGRRRPPLHRPPAHVVVPAGGGRRQLGARPGGVELVRGGARRAGALPGLRRRRVPGGGPVPARRGAGLPVAVAPEHGAGPCGARRAHHHRRDGVRQLRHLPRRRVHDQRRRAARADDRGHLPGGRRRHGGGGARRARAAEPAPVRPAAAGRGRRGVAGGRRQRVRLHDGHGHLRQRPRVGPRLAARLRAAGLGRVRPDGDAGRGRAAPAARSRPSASPCRTCR